MRGEEEEGGGASVCGGDGGGAGVTGAFSAEHLPPGTWNWRTTSLGSLPMGSETGGLVFSGSSKERNLHAERYETIMGSDVARDGMFLELWDRSIGELALWAFYWTPIVHSSSPASGPTCRPRWRRGSSRRHIGRDLEAGIAKRGRKGPDARRACALRTIGILLSKGGALHHEPAQAAMRHSDIRLTMGIYTDPKLLDVRGCLMRCRRYLLAMDKGTLPMPQERRERTTCVILRLHFRLHKLLTNGYKMGRSLSKRHKKGRSAASLNPST